MFALQADMAKRVHKEVRRDLRGIRAMFNHPFQSAVSYLSIGLLAVSSLAFGQDAGPQSNTATNQQQTVNSSGGWKRVGDAQTGGVNNVSGNPAYSANQPAPNGAYQGEDMQNPPPPPPPASSYNQSPYQQPAGNQPYGQPPYQTQQQPNYGPQQSYGPQQNYPPPPPVPASLTIVQGTYVTVRINQLLSSDKNQPGDAFSASLVDPVVVNGVVVAEPGQTLGGRVALVEKHGMGKEAKLGIQLTNLTLVDGQQIPINTQLTSRRGATTPGGVEAGSVIATTGLGAAIGAAAGWGTGAAIGAGAGALAGLIGVVATHNHASVITPEQILTFQVQAPVTFSTTASSAAFRYVQPGEYSQPSQPYPAGAAGGPYVATSPAPYYAYGYPYPYYGYGYPYYWGPSFAFYYGPGYWWGGRYYHRGGYYGGYRGGVVVHGGAVAVHGSVRR